MRFQDNKCSKHIRFFILSSSIVRVVIQCTGVQFRWRSSKIREESDCGVWPPRCQRQGWPEALRPPYCIF
jgi:hypothetical protein